MFAFCIRLFNRTSILSRRNCPPPPKKGWLIKSAFISHISNLLIWSMFRQVSHILCKSLDIKYWEQDGILMKPLGACRLIWFVVFSFLRPFSCSFSCWRIEMAKQHRDDDYPLTTHRQPSGSANNHQSSPNSQTMMIQPESAGSVTTDHIHRTETLWRIIIDAISLAICKILIDISSKIIRLISF